MKDNGYKEAKEAVLSYIDEQSLTPLTEGQREAVFYFAWDHGHSYGVNEVKVWVDEALGLIGRFLKG